MTRPAAPAVWIVDDDLGFVWWLGEIFTAAGCRALPALDSEGAVSLMKRVGIEPDLVVVNPDLEGASGMVQRLVRGNRHLKIVSIGEPPAEFSEVVRVHAVLERPTSSELVSRSEWLKKVRKVLKDTESAAAV